MKKVSFVVLLFSMLVMWDKAVQAAIVITIPNGVYNITSALNNTKVIDSHRCFWGWQRQWH